MAIISMDPDIHGYPIRWARVRSAFFAHGFHGADIHELMGWAWTWISLHGYPSDVRLIGETHMSVTQTMQIIPITRP